MGGQARHEPAELDAEVTTRRGEPFHVQQADQIRAFREAWKEAGHTREPRVSVSRSIFALVDDRDRAYFGDGDEERGQFGFIDDNRRASSAAATPPSRTCLSSSSTRTKPSPRPTRCC